MQRRIVVIIAFCSIWTTHDVQAQSAGAGNAEGKLAAPANLSFGAVAGVPTGDMPASAIQLLLDASQNQKVGTIAVGWKNGQQSHLQLTLSGPLDEGTQRATPVSLLGLPTGASAKLSASRLNWRGPNGVEQLEIQELCTKLARTLGITECHTENENIPLIERTALRQLLHVDDVAWFIGGDVGVERNLFRYLERGTFDSKSENHQNWGAAGRIGFFSQALGFVIGSYAHRRSFSAAGAPAEVCLPIDGTTAFRCQSSIIGAPQRKTLKVGSVELRKFFASPIAVTPSIQRDFENDVTAIDVPLYFLRSDLKLTGGVRFGWRSDTEDVTVLVFVGTAIQLLPQ